MHAIDQLAAKAVPEEPKPAAAAPSAEAAVLPPPPSRRVTRSQSKVSFNPTQRRAARRPVDLSLAAACRDDFAVLTKLG